MNAQMQGTNFIEGFLLVFVYILFVYFRSCVCDLKSTTYENMPGSHHCKCRDGFKSNLECRPTLDLGLSDQQNIPNDAIIVSGEEEGYPKERIRLNSDLGLFTF